MPPRLLLASSSPRRRDLLQMVGLSFDIARPDIDETPHPDEPGDDYVARLSREKALAVRSQAQDGDYEFVLTADTTVADGKQILGKPEDAQDAFKVLSQLRARSHSVYTGVSLLEVDTNSLFTHVITTEVIMRDYTDEEITAYIESGDPFGKAGSYAIQNESFHPVERIIGCYTNVVGLPLCAVAAFWKARGILPPIPVACSSQLLPCLFAR